MEKIDFSKFPTDQLDDELLDELIPPVAKEAPFSSCIIVDNLPVVPQVSQQQNIYIYIYILLTRFVFVPSTYVGCEGCLSLLVAALI